MFALKLLRNIPLSKSTPRFLTARPSSTFFKPPRIAPSPATPRALHQSSQTRALPLRTRIPPATSIRSHVSTRTFTTKRPLRQQQQQQGPQSRYNAGTSRRGRGLGLGGLAGGGYKPILILAGGGAAVVYFSNLETVPVSGRRRFNVFSEASAEQQGDMAYQQIMAQGRSEGKLLPEWDARVLAVKRVLGRLVEGGGEELGRVEWEVNVLDSEEANAFVLPGGKVFVYTGILPITRNDEGLAAVLGHEIAHNLAQHSAERMSGAVIVQILIWMATIGEVAFLGGNGQLSNFLSQFALDFGIMRPASRQQESEADYIGLLLMAQSCYDPKAAVGMWQRMQQAQKGAPPEWLSTHPSNESRITHITEWLPKAEEKRSEAGCAATQAYSQEFQSVMSLFR